MDAPTLTGLVPLVVGVTGHRDIRPEDLPELERTVRAVFDDIQRLDPGRPLVLLTPLAEGADILAARVAIERGTRLIVPLPFPRGEYEQTFSDQGLAEFRRLVDGGAVINRVDMPAISSHETLLTPESRRDLQYALVGAYVARYADIMIALWSGIDSDLIGGTAQVVHFRRAGRFRIDPAFLEVLAQVPEPFGVQESLLDPPDVGPLYHIATPRHDHPEARPEITSRYLLPFAYSGESAGGTSDSGATESYAEHLDDIAKHIREFNRDAERLAASHEGRIDASAQELFPDPEHVVAERLPSGLAWLRRAFAFADALAIQYQRRVHRVLLGMFVLIFIAAVAFAFYAHGFEKGETGSRAMIGVYAAIIGLADVLFLIAKGRHWQDKHQDYRAVAEGLRVQFYWRLAGLPHLASAYYVRKQRDDLSWIPRVVTACGLISPVMPVDATNDQLRTVHSLWSDRQAAYYANVRDRAQRRLRWREAGSGALGMSLAIGLAIVWRESGESVPLRFVFDAALLTLIAHVIIEIRDFVSSEHGPHERGLIVGDAMARIGGIVAAFLTVGLLTELPIWMQDIPGWTLEPPASMLLTALAVTAVAGALLHGHSERRAFAEHARHYGRMAVLFRRATNRLSTLLSAGDVSRAQELVRELGKEALYDHGEWVKLHRDLPIELPETGV